MIIYNDTGILISKGFVSTLIDAFSGTIESKNSNVNKYV